MDSADTAAEEAPAQCSGLSSLVVWLYPGIAQDLARCEIPLGTVFSVPYQEERMDNTIAAPSASSTNPAVVPAPVDKAEIVEKVVDDAAKVEASKAEPVAHEEVAAPISAPLDPMAVAQNNPMLALALAVVAVVGGGAGFKLWTKMSEQKHEQKMKMLELQAQANAPTVQPPPCQAAQAKTEAQLASLEARLGKMEKASHGLPDASLGDDVDELKTKVTKLESAVKRIGLKAKS